MSIEILNDKEMSSLNRKEHKPGDVVYFVRNRSWGKEVDYGTVIDNFPGTVCIQIYELFDRRLINGIPYSEFETPTRWQKLPKGWSYDTKLFDKSTAPLSDAFMHTKLQINNPADIRKAIDMKILVPVRSIDHREIESEVDKVHGWRLVRRSNGDVESQRDWISVDFSRVYSTWDEAKNEIDVYYAELHRQSELSDRDWAIEQIDHELSRVTEYTDSERKAVRDFLLSRDRVEDIEVRWSAGGLVWRYYDHKRWMHIEI